MNVVTKEIIFDDHHRAKFVRIDDEVKIYLHDWDRDLDPVTSTSSEYYLRNYFRQYGFNEDIVWLELQLFIGNDAVIKKLKDALRLPQIRDEPELNTKDRIWRCIERLDDSIGVSIEEMETDLQLSRGVITSAVADLVNEIRIYRNDASHYKNY